MIKTFIYPSFLFLIENSREAPRIFAAGASRLLGAWHTSLAHTQGFLIYLMNSSNLDPCLPHPY